MAVLERIRVKFGVAITVIIAIALLSFIIDPSTLSSVMYSMSSKYDVGQIDGKRIDYQRYQQDVDTYNKLNEIITGSSASSDEQQKNVRDAAWQSLVDEYLFIKNCKAAGLYVGKDEKIDLTTGNEVSPILARDPNFADENGVFSVDRLKDFVQQVSSDESGRLKIYWDYLQKAVVTAAYYQKYNSLFTSSNVENALMSARAIEENNTTANIEFVMVPVGYAADSTVQVTDRDVEKYYKAHKKDYKCDASRDIEYVVFEVKPSTEDIAAANEKIAALYDEFVKTDNSKSFLRNSDRKFDGRWYGRGELNSVDRKVAEFVDENKVGAVSKVIEGDEAFYAVRILDKKMMPNDIDVKLAVAGNVEKIDADLEAKLDASEAMNMTQDRMVSGCEVLFDAPLNKARLIDSPQYGKLAAKVVKKSAPVEKKQVAILSKNIVAGKATYNDYYSRANTMAVRSAGNYKSFKAAADSLHLYVNSQNRVLESTRTIGTVDGCTEVVRWVFDQKKGAVSNIISVANNAFFVVAVKEIREEGYTPLKEVAAGIRMNLYQEQVAAHRKAEVAEKIAGMETMSQVAEALDTEVSTKEGVAFSSAGGQSLDPVLIGAVASAEVGKVSGPVSSLYTIYVYNVLSRETGSFYNEDDAKALDAQKAQYYAQMIVPVMSEGKVKDNRARFY
ncbi:MAG: SurA N-terminal domain-containing protein [Bacteroidales bacterium]|nr:SurA N-terminal domain-containing protein [Bacteroidales bacterium]